MKKLFLFAWLISGSAFAWPDSIRCKPQRFYSGGFDIYEIHKTMVNNQEQYVGYRYWQKTSGHGVLIGRPVLVSRVALLSTLEGQEIVLNGFVSSFEKTDSLKFPVTWNGGRITLRSALFDNDLYTDGECTFLTASSEPTKQLTTL